MQPYFTEGDANKSALEYATNRMRGRPGEIRVMDAAGNIERTLTFKGRE